MLEIRNILYVLSFRRQPSGTGEHYFRLSLSKLGYFHYYYCRLREYCRYARYMYMYSVRQRNTINSHLILYEGTVE